MVDTGTNESSESGEEVDKRVHARDRIRKGKEEEYAHVTRNERQGAVDTMEKERSRTSTCTAIAGAGRFLRRFSFASRNSS